MKRQIIICFSIFFLLCFIVIFYILNRMDKNVEEIETQNNSNAKQTTEIMEELEPESKYILRNSDGVLEVYYSKSNKLYQRTSILVDSLPIEKQMLLESGIEIKDDAELLDFLESYSS